MRLQVKGRHVELSQALKEYAQKKLGKLEKHLNDSARVELELAAERNPVHRRRPRSPRGPIWTNGHVLRAQERVQDMKASIDLLVDKLERQAKRLHDKRRRKPAAHDAAPRAGRARTSAARLEGRPDRQGRSSSR